MDTAYDHIQEENFAKPATEAGSNSNSNSDSSTRAPAESTAASASTASHPAQQPQASLNDEIQDAYRAVANSPWGATLGGLWGSVRKTSEQYLEEAQKQGSVASEQASRGWADLVSRTRSLSVAQGGGGVDGVGSAAGAKGDGVGSVAEKQTVDVEAHPDRPESLPADIVKEAQSLVWRFRSEAAKRLKDIEKAEDAADEALLKLGNNIKTFLQEAVSIAPPTEITSAAEPDRVLFESRDAEGKRVIHTNRLDAQMHNIHASLDSFLKDPAGKEFEAWKGEFDIDSKTEVIAKDLEKSPELRTAMEKLVPEQIDYATFWQRYYFLKRVAELEEQRRKELLKGAVSGANEEEVAWDEDSEDEKANTPNADRSTPTLPKEAKQAGSGSLKPSDLLSQPDSEASYDLVSRTASRAGGSPKEGKVEEESDEDWE